MNEKATTTIEIRKGSKRTFWVATITIKEGDISISDKVYASSESDLWKKIHKAI